MHGKIKSPNIPILLLLACTSSVSSYTVKLTDNAPIVKGANVTFTARLYDDQGLVPSGSFRFSWRDAAAPTHIRQVETKAPEDTWVVKYDENLYPEGLYVAQVIVEKYYVVLWVQVASSRIQFYINETLNGEIQLIQKNHTLPASFVSNRDVVVHNISLKETDSQFIKNAPSVLTYWFIDCTYYSVQKDFTFSFNYTHPEEEHLVEALVVVDFTPLPPPPTTTTTTTAKPTTTTTPKPTTTTPKPTTTTPKPTTTSKATTTTKVTTTTKATPTTTTTEAPKNGTKAQVIKRDVEAPRNSTAGRIMQLVNGTLQPYDGFFPYVCNSSVVATDPSKTYGYFFKRISVKAPVSKVNVTGNNWLQHGELLTLNVKCHGSKNLRYCVKYEKGVYNVTGNESCTLPAILEKCEFSIHRYFMESTQHTIVIIIENEVSRVVTPVAVTVYKVTKQAQLSVIVVPVAFSLVAVVLIVFGVAYYIQNRSRFVVEVADFNFGQNYSDMEYKTFKERLRDSIANAFFSRAPSPGSSEVPVWPPGRKYGSMAS